MVLTGAPGVFAQTLHHFHSLLNDTVLVDVEEGGEVAQPIEHRASNLFAAYPLRTLQCILTLYLLFTLTIQLYSKISYTLLRKLWKQSYFALLGISFIDILHILRQPISIEKTNVVIYTKSIHKYMETLLFSTPSLMSTHALLALFFDPLKKGLDLSVYTYLAPYVALVGIVLAGLASPPSVQALLSTCPTLLSSPCALDRSKTEDFNIQTEDSNNQTEDTKISDGNNHGTESDTERYRGETEEGTERYASTAGDDLLDHNPTQGEPHGNARNDQIDRKKGLDNQDTSNPKSNSSKTVRSSKRKKGKKQKKKMRISSSNSAALSQSVSKLYNAVTTYPLYSLFTLSDFVNIIFDGMFIASAIYQYCLVSKESSSNPVLFAFDIMKITVLFLYAFRRVKSAHLSLLEYKRQLFSDLF
jgi:hypothetical protein